MPSWHILHAQQTRADIVIHPWLTRALWGSLANQGRILRPVFTAIFYKNSWEPFVKIVQLEIIYFWSLQNKRSCWTAAASGSPKLKWVIFHKFTWATSFLFCQFWCCCCIKGKAWTWTSEGIQDLSLGGHMQIFIWNAFFWGEGS